MVKANGDPAVADVVVYVDGFNLYYGSLKRTPTNGSTSRVCVPPCFRTTVIAIKYYTARISARPGNPGAPNDQQIYLRALRTIPNLSITYGHFLTHSVSMALTGVTPTKRVWVDKTEEKGSDVNLASHLVRDAFRGAFQAAVLITNDSDLAEPVRIVRQELNLPVGILNPHQQHSAELKRIATFVKRIRQSDVIASQFAAVLNDAKGAIHKPPSW